MNQSKVGNTMSHLFHSLCSHLFTQHGFKNVFFLIPKNLLPLSQGGGGVKALVAGPLRKDFFLRLPYVDRKKNLCKI